MAERATAARIGRGLAGAAALALAAGCGGGARPAARAGEPSTTLSALDGRLDLDGRTVAATGRADVTATAVVFFATWCHPCRRELAALTELAARTPGLHVIGLNVYEEWGEQSDPARMRGFLAEHAPRLEVVPMADDLKARFGGVPKIPTLLIFDRRGAAVAEFRSDRRAPPGPAELEATVARAMAR